MLAASSQPEIVEVLRQRLLQWEAVRRPVISMFSSGCRAVDQLLPGTGLRRGTLIEYLADGGSGAIALSLIAAREACRDSGTLFVVGSQLHPPAAANMGIDMTGTVFIRPRTRKDQLWALLQALSCQGVGAVLCRPETLDDRAFRSLQLAAETNGTVGLFIRPVSVRGHPTWSELQLLVEALPGAARTRRLRIEVVRCRNGKSGASVEVELDDETGMLQESHAMPVATPMAVATAAQSTARA